MTAALISDSCRVKPFQLNSGSVSSSFWVTVRALCRRPASFGVEVAPVFCGGEKSGSPSITSLLRGNTLPPILTSSSSSSGKPSAEVGSRGNSSSSPLFVTVISWSGISGRKRALFPTSSSPSRSGISEAVLEASSAASASPSSASLLAASTLTSTLAASEA